MVELQPVLVGIEMEMVVGFILLIIIMLCASRIIHKRPVF